KGAAASYTAVLSGEVQIALPDIGRAVEDAAAGNVKMLGISGDERSPLAPDVPTVKEMGAQGVRGYWLGLFAPAGTPDAIIGKIQADIVEVSKTPEAQEALASFSMKIVASTPDELGARLAAEISDWSKIAESLGLEK